MASPAINVAVMAAAAKQAEAVKSITETLLEAGADGPRKAITLDLTADGAADAFKSMLDSGHVRDVGGGRYWLDVDAIARSKARAGRIALIVLAFLLSAGASLLALAAFG